MYFLQLKPSKIANWEGMKINKNKKLTYTNMDNNRTFCPYIYFLLTIYKLTIFKKGNENE